MPDRRGDCHTPLSRWRHVRHRGDRRGAARRVASARLRDVRRSRRGAPHRGRAPRSSASVPPRRCSSRDARTRRTAGATLSRAVSSEQWLADVSGCSETPGARLAEDRAATRGAARDGSEAPRGCAVADAGDRWSSKAAEVDPEAERKLLRSAERDGLRTLRDRSDRVIAAATDEDEAYARAKRERHVRTWRDGMATRGSFSGPTAEVDVLLRALEPLAKARGDEARQGRRA